MKRVALVVSPLLLLLLLVPLALRAEPEDTAKKMAQAEELMRRLQEMEAAAEAEGPEFAFERENPPVLRVYNVADLTVRLTNFIAPNLELKAAGTEVDECAPLFGKAEEGERFFSGVEDLMDLLIWNVRPEVWESSEASINVSGEFGLVVVAMPEVHEDVASYLDLLRVSVGRNVTVQARLLRVKEPGATLLPAGRSALALDRAAGLALLKRAEKGQGIELVDSVRISCFNGQQVMLHRGTQRSFIQDYDVEVAQESSISDPIVGILQTGLAFQIRPVARGNKQIILDLRAQFSSAPEVLRTAVTASGPIHAPEVGLISFSTTVTIPDRSFALVGAAGGADRLEWCLLLSARMDRIVSEDTGGAR